MQTGWVLIFAGGGAGVVLWLVAHGVERAIELFNDIAGLE